MSNEAYKFVKKIMRLTPRDINEGLMSFWAIDDLLNDPWLKEILAESIESNSSDLT